MNTPLVVSAPTGEAETDTPTELWLRQAIHNWRKTWGLSQGEVGERLGLTRQTIAGWETDGALPHRQMVIFAYERLDQVVRAEQLAAWEMEHRSPFSLPPAPVTFEPYVP